MPYLLDTSFIIDHLRSLPEAVRRLEALAAGTDPLFVTSVVVTETWTGSPSPDDRALTSLLSFLEYVHPAPDQARVAGLWRADARRRGHALSLSDALIAATADSLGAAVLTRNVRDFALTPIRVETY
jgi:predicted nucleic acid-binding protein